MAFLKNQHFWNDILLQTNKTFLSVEKNIMIFNEQQTNSSFFRLFNLFFKLGTKNVEMLFMTATIRNLMPIKFLILRSLNSYNTGKIPSSYLTNNNVRKFEIDVIVLPFLSNEFHIVKESFKKKIILVSLTNHNLNLNKLSYSNFMSNSCYKAIYLSYSILTNALLLGFFFNFSKKKLKS